MYQHGRRTSQPKNFTVLLATIAIAGVVFLIGWYIVHKDIATKTGPKTSLPIVSEVSEDGDNTNVFDENYFSITLPGDWEFVESKNTKSVNYFKYRSTAKVANDRVLTVYVDVLPEVYKLVKMQPIIPNGNTILLGNLSDDCVNFGTNHQVQSNAPFEAKWENVTFICDPIKANQTIGTGTTGTGISSRIGNHNYFFYFEDHNIRPDSNIFRNALQSFKSK